MTEHPELKTIGLTPAIYCGDQALFHVTRNVPLGDALAMASDFCSSPRSSPKMLLTPETPTATPGPRII